MQRNRTDGHMQLFSELKQAIMALPSITREEHDAKYEALLLLEKLRDMYFNTYVRSCKNTEAGGEEEHGKERECESGRLRETGG